jgi:hypothetical protein
MLTFKFSRAASCARRSCIAFVGLSGFAQSRTWVRRWSMETPARDRPPLPRVTTRLPAAPRTTRARARPVQSRSCRGTPHGQYEPWGSISKHSLQFSVRTFRVYFHVLRLCVELREPGAPLTFGRCGTRGHQPSAQTVFSVGAGCCCFVFPLGSCPSGTIRGGVRNSSTQHNPVT